MEQDIVNSKLRKLAAEGKLVIYYQGVAVSNPFMDESGRFYVEPIEYYGEELLITAILTAECCSN